MHYRPRWGLRGSGLGRAGNVATWTLVGLAVGQLGYIVVSRVASQAPGAAAGARAVACAAPGAVAGNAAYDYAFLIFMLPHSLVTVSLATALFTRLSGQAHDADVDGVRATLSSRAARRRHLHHRRDRGRRRAGHADHAARAVDGHPGGRARRRRRGARR